MADHAFRSAAALATDIQRREIGCRELLEHYLTRIERYNPVVNAVVTLDVEGARHRADEADAALDRKEVWGPLHGLPMTIKDAFETMGMRTTCGFPPLADYVPRQDAIAVGRLVGAGANVIGKTNVPTLTADVQTHNALFGVTVNPWDATRTPGGSSGGAAAALAAGLTAFELGSDIGGSIRTPSNWCGIFGHKPTHGIVPLRGHVPPMPGAQAEPDLAVAGPMGRSADDLALGLEVLVGPSPDRAAAWRLELPQARTDELPRFRIGTWLDDPAFPVDPEVREVLERAVVALARGGAQVDEGARPKLDLAETVRIYLQLLLPIVLADLPAAQFEALVAAGRDLPADADDAFARTARFGAIGHREWMVANEQREQIRLRWNDFFRGHDALLLPVVPVTAIPHDPSEPLFARTITVGGARRPYHDLFSWIGLATMALLPATVAPVGRTRSGLPVGIQIVGPYLEDRTTIELARHLERLVGGFEAPPGF